MRSIRFLAPVGVAGAIALGAWIPTITAAGAATPDLPSITPAQLLAKVQQSHVAGFSGTVRWTANLGLPDISGLTSGAGQSSDHGGFDPTTLLTGSHDISVWSAGASEQRLALPGTLNEYDVVHNGTNLWTFDSATQAVTHYVQAPGSHGQSHDAGPSDPSDQAFTPAQAAQRAIDSVTPTTSVTVASPVYVAGRPTYELVLAPKAATSTVKDVTIAVDSATGMPLRVQVTPAGTTVPALSLGFTSVSFSVPAGSVFAAPSGTSTVTKTIGGADGSAHNGKHGSGSHPTVTGTGWGSIVTITDANLGRTGRQLDQVSSPVSGAFGTARLVHTNLLNALILPDGRVLAGFVTPAALEAAAASSAG